MPCAGASAGSIYGELFTDNTKSRVVQVESSRERGIFAITMMECASKL